MSLIYATDLFRQVGKHHLSINSFSFAPYQLPLSEPYTWAKGSQRERSGLIVRFEAEGSVGYGEVAPPPNEKVDAAKLFEEAREKLSTLDPKSKGFLFDLDQQNLHPRLRCGVSSAWCMAMAHQEGLSLSRYLASNGRNPAKKVPVNALITSDDLSLVSGTVREAIAQGIRTVKVKCVGNRERDLCRVRAVRAESDDLSIRIDPNGVWSEEEVGARLAEFSQFEIEYVEQPISASASIERLMKLRASSPIKIALDESAKDLDTIDLLLKEGAASHLILKPQRLGGPDKVFLAIQLAEKFNVGCTVTGSLETVIGTTVALHCAALIKPPIPAAGIGTGRYFMKDLGPALVIQDGSISV